MRHILVTGGAGFIGSHLVDALLTDGLRLTVVDSFDPFYDRADKERNISAHRRHPAWRLVEIDVRDIEGLRRELADRYDAVVHLAARGGVRPSLADPLGYYDVNVRGTHNVLELARERAIPRVVFASSSSVYGVNPRVPWREDDAVLQPISPYASTKISAELLGHVYSHLYGIQFIALRFFTVFGPRQRPDLALHKFARLISAGDPVPVYGDGSTRRDYTYVGDIVSGVRAALDAQVPRFDVINLGNHGTVSVLEAIGALERALDTKAVIDWQPDQPGDVPQTWASIDKARAMLGYEPATPFEEGVVRFVEWSSRLARV